MDTVGNTLYAANELYIRQTNTTSNGTAVTTNPDTTGRPPVYKAIGISLAIASGCFIGVSFVLKKIGLLRANEKYSEVAGEGYGYLKNAFWWSGMTLMIIGEICNFVAYAFVDAILVTPLGALSVVITTILSAIFLKERLSLVGKIGCFLCIVGSIVIVMNAPSESSAATIQEMQHYVITPGFLVYAGLIIAGSAFTAFWVGPRYGKKSMLVYLSICSWIGGLSVVATQGLGAAIVSQIAGIMQFNQWFLYVLFVFVITTLVTEIIFLNKALNLFNAALVTPTYYVYFTSTTIITSAILFQGFKGTPTSIVTCVLGFFVICSGVVLLQLSKSAKDVPDAAVFSGDLDQVRTIAEQEQSEMDPKADAIRGAGLGTIVRRMSQARSRMELDEAKRLHDEKRMDLEPVVEDEVVEWDGLRRRRTTLGSRNTATPRINPSTPVQHPPLGMSHFPSYHEDSDEENRLPTGGLQSSFLGTIRDRARSMIHPHGEHDIQSPMHPVPLTEINVPAYKSAHSDDPYLSPEPEHVYGLPAGLRHQETEYKGAGSTHIHFSEQRSSSRGSAPDPPPHGAKRQFSFHNVFRKGQQDAHTGLAGPAKEASPAKPVSRKGLGSRQGSHQAVKGATEEERLGLVKGDTHLTQIRSNDDSTEDDEGLSEWEIEGKRHVATAVPVVQAGRGRDVAISETRDFARAARDKEDEASVAASYSSRDDEAYAEQRRKWEQQQQQNKSKPLPGPPTFREDKGDGGAFI